MGQLGHKDQEPNIFQNSTSPTHASLFFEKKPMSQSARIHFKQTTY